jgi:hypothetical protein
MTRVQTNFRAEDMIGASAGPNGASKKPAKKAAAAPKPASDEVPEGTAEEVVDWVDGDVAKAKKALAVEQKDESPRKTVVEPLQKIIDDDKEAKAAKKTAAKKTAETDKA